MDFTDLVPRFPSTWDSSRITTWSADCGPEFKHGVWVSFGVVRTMGVTTAGWQGSICPDNSNADILQGSPRMVVS